MGFLWDNPMSIDIADLQDEVNEIRANALSESSRKAYEDAIVRQLMFYLEYEPQIISVHLRDIFFAEFAELEVFANENTEQASRRQRKAMELFIRQYLKQAPSNPPIAFEEMTSDLFIKYIATMRNKKGDKPGISTFRGQRTGLFNLFRMYGLTLSNQLSMELTRDYQGLGRLTALRVTNGEGNITSGKDPMDFSLYKFIAHAQLKSDQNQQIFGHCFLSLTWNLMCRAGSCSTICFKHLEWREDALCVYFAHMKNDQTGSKKRDPRHVYANPVMPSCCPITALGIYLLCFDINTNGKLFPGSAQYERFRKILNKVLKASCLHELKSRGFTPEDIGTHSIRKGATSYCSGGSTAGPSGTAINLRGG